MGGVIIRFGLFVCFVHDCFVLFVCCLWLVCLIGSLLLVYCVGLCMFFFVLLLCCVQFVCVDRVLLLLVCLMRVVCFCLHIVWLLLCVLFVCLFGSCDCVVCLLFWLRVCFECCLLVICSFSACVLVLVLCAMCLFCWYCFVSLGLFSVVFVCCLRFDRVLLVDGLFIVCVLLV